MNLGMRLTESILVWCRLMHKQWMPGAFLLLPAAICAGVGRKGVLGYQHRQQRTTKCYLFSCSLMVVILDGVSKLDKTIASQRGRGT